MNPGILTRRILRTFDQATPEEIEAGLNWYATARAECQSIARNQSLPLHVVVGVVAALSPNNKWSRNLRDAEQMIAKWSVGLAVNDVAVCTYKAMRQKAWDILNSHRRDHIDLDGVLTLLNGQKIVAFAECILGRDACCIDGHAFNIAMGERKNLTSPGVNVGKRMFRDLQSAYARAAKRRGLAAYEMQAITWTAWRRVHGIA